MPFSHYTLPDLIYKYNIYVMDYLKLFESFEPPYVMITSQEFNLSLDYDDNSYHIINKLRRILPDVEYTSIDSASNSISFNSSIGTFNIKFRSDEWFKVKFITKHGKVTKFWKCDQIDGLIGLLKHLRLL